MARLRIHTQDEDEDSSITLRLKARSKQTVSTTAGSSNPQNQSPVKVLDKDSQPRKQRVLKKVENNSVLLVKSSLTPSIKPSKFCRAKIETPPTRHEAGPISYRGWETSGNHMNRLPPSTITRAVRLGTNGSSSASSAILISSRTEDITKLAKEAAVSGPVKADDDETIEICRPPTKSSRRRLVVESDSESESDIDDIFAPVPPCLSSFHSKPEVSGISTPSEQLLRETMGHNINLESALLEQGFQFGLPAPIDCAVDSESTTSRPATSSGLDLGAVLSFEPPKSRSPVKLAPQRPVTPTKDVASTRLTLKSPTKSLRIPRSPHKPDSDEFWCPSAVNDWVDEHSPQKIIKSPSRDRFRSPSVDGQVVDLTHISSPQKSPTKAQRQARKIFNERKHDVASKFLNELDRDITGGRIAELSKSTGGVKIQWSNKLNSTAGRAHWRKQSIRKQHSDGSISTTINHTASIELAEKVLDEEHRLINTIAHEFCHLATFMIDSVKTNPHGKEFKEWARKCSVAFGHRGVQVTTKHSYDIDYKYVWECSSCGIEYKRHSKSIDTAKQRCGGCKSALVQTRPIPRQVKISDYQIFVKENFQKVKSQSIGASHGSIMETLGKLYRESKEKLQETAVDVDVLALDMQAVQL